MRLLALLLLVACLVSAEVVATERNGEVVVEAESFLFSMREDGFEMDRWSLTQNPDAR